MVKLAKYYLDNWSVRLDLAILLKTPVVVLARRGGVLAREFVNLSCAVGSLVADSSCVWPSLRRQPPR
jgi:hypothetical protein